MENVAVFPVPVIREYNQLLKLIKKNLIKLKINFVKVCNNGGGSLFTFKLFEHYPLYLTTIIHCPQSYYLTMIQEQVINL